MEAGPRNKRECRWALASLPNGWDGSHSRLVQRCWSRHDRIMTKALSLLAACIAGTALAVSAVGSAATGPVGDAAVGGDPRAQQDQSRSDQGDARREMRAGNKLPLREIERRILPQMRGAEYLGPLYDSTARAYRLKFIRDGRVIYVDVDARTGQIINRSN